MGDLDKISDGDSVIVMYFNATSGKMREKSLTVNEVTSEHISLEETLGPSEYRFFPSEERLDMKRDGDWVHLGNDASLEKH